MIHSHQTLVCESHQLADQNRPIGDRQLVAAPVGHFIGMVGALLIPVLNGMSINLVDAYPGRVLALMESDGLTLGGGPPYFVTSLLDHPDCTPAHRAHIKGLGLGGAPVPAAVTRRLSDLGIIVFRSYGSTEHPSITGSRFDAPQRNDYSPTATRCPEWRSGWRPTAKSSGKVQKRLVREGIAVRF